MSSNYDPHYMDQWNRDRANADPWHGFEVPYGSLSRHGQQQQYTRPNWSASAPPTVSLSRTDHMNTTTDTSDEMGPNNLDVQLLKTISTEFERDQIPRAMRSILERFWGYTASLGAADSEAANPTSIDGQSLQPSHTTGRLSSRSRWRTRESKRGPDSASMVASPEHRPVACPFHKKTPNFYKDRTGQVEGMEAKRYKTCSHGSESIRRLKDHLREVHLRGVGFCDCCLAIFKTKEHRVEHKGRCPGVNPRDQNYQSQLETLKRLERVIYGPRKQQGTSIPDTWNEIWTILFPENPRPESPWQEIGPLEYAFNQAELIIVGQMADRYKELRNCHSRDEAEKWFRKFFVKFRQEVQKNHDTRGSSTECNARRAIESATNPVEFLDWTFPLTSDPVTQPLSMSHMSDTVGIGYGVDPFSGTSTSGHVPHSSGHMSNANLMDDIDMDNLRQGTVRPSALNMSSRPSNYRPFSVHGSLMQQPSLQQYQHQQPSQHHYQHQQHAQHQHQYQPQQHAQHQQQAPHHHHYQQQPQYQQHQQGQQYQSQHDQHHQQQRPPPYGRWS